MWNGSSPISYCWRRGTWNTPFNATTKLNSINTPVVWISHPPNFVFRAHNINAFELTHSSFNFSAIFSVVVVVVRRRLLLPIVRHVLKLSSPMSVLLKCLQPDFAFVFRLHFSHIYILPFSMWMCLHTVFRCLGFNSCSYCCDSLSGITNAYRFTWWYITICCSFVVLLETYTICFCW